MNQVYRLLWVNLICYQALNDSLTEFYSNEGETFNPSDVCIDRSTDKKRIVVCVNMNLVKVGCLSWHDLMLTCLSN